MRIVVDSKGLRAEAQATNQRRQSLTKEAWKAMRSVSLAVERRVKNTMPWDTGRARSSWGHWSPGMMVRENRFASPDDSVWEESLAEMKITQGTNVEYVPALNAGHSRKAPAGFIEAAEEAGLRELDGLIDEIMRHW
jgi:hypothetical protein